MSPTRSRAAMIEAAIEIIARIGALHCAGGHGDCGDIVGDAAEGFSRPADRKHMRILRHGGRRWGGVDLVESRLLLELKESRCFGFVMVLLAAARSASNPRT